MTTDKIKEQAQELYSENHNDNIFTPTVRQLQQNAFVKGHTTALSQMESEMVEFDRWKSQNGWTYEYETYYTNNVDKLILFTDLLTIFRNREGK